MSFVSCDIQGRDQGQDKERENRMWSLHRDRDRAHMSTPGEMDTRIHPSIHFSHDLLYWVATFNLAFTDILQQSVSEG